MLPRKLTKLANYVRIQLYIANALHKLAKCHLGRMKETPSNLERFQFDFCVYCNHRKKRLAITKNCLFKISQ